MGEEYIQWNRRSTHSGKIYTREKQTYRGGIYTKDTQLGETYKGETNKKVHERETNSAVSGGGKIYI